MRVIILSDTHGSLASAWLALEEAGPVDFIVHAGDLYSDAGELAEKTGLPFKAVRGNCDVMEDGPHQQVFELGGHTFFLAHGHQGGGPGLWEKWLLERACRYQAKVAVYGHTHRAVIAEQRGVLVINPGSITLPRDGGPPSYCLLKITENFLEPQICRLKNRSGPGRRY